MIKGVAMEHRDLVWHRKHMSRMMKRKNREAHAYSKNILHKIPNKKKVITTTKSLTTWQKIIKFFKNLFK